MNGYGDGKLISYDFYHCFPHQLSAFCRCKPVRMKNNAYELPPWQDLSLNDRKNEIWKNIPGLKGGFQVSCFGRIKRMPGTRITRDGVSRNVTPKILRLRVLKTYNKFCRDYCYSLGTFFLCHGKKYSFQISRLVYYVFVERFKMKDYLLVVSAKNGDRLDVRPDNLLLETRSVAAKRVVDTGRYKNHWKNKSIQKTEAFKLSIADRKVQVSCYDEKGRWIKTYNSVREAAFDTGAQESCISTALNKLTAKAIGFYWRRGAANMINFKDLNSYVHERTKKRNSVKGAPVRQYTLSGTFIREYSNAAKAAKATGLNYGSVWQALYGRQSKAGGFVWKTGGIE